MSDRKFDPPADLDDAERRLYELARDPMPLAELAVRLGVPVPDAQARLSALLRKLNVPDRATLRERGAAPLAADAQTRSAGVAGLPPVEVAPPPDTPALTLSRRRLLAGAAAGLAGAAATAGGVLLAVARRGEGDVPAATAPTPTPNPQLSADPTPTVTAIAAATWDTAIFDSDQPIDWDHGLFSIRVAGGSIAAWRTEGAPIPASTNSSPQRDIPRYSLTRGGQFIVAELSRETRLFDRDTGESRSRPKQDRSPALIAGDGSRFVFFDHICRVTDTQLNLVSTFDAAARYGPPALIEPSGARVALFSGAGTSEASVVLVALNSGDLHRSRRVDVPAGFLMWPRGMWPVPNSNLFVASMYFRGDGRGDGAAAPTPPGVYFLLDWDGPWEQASARAETPYPSYAPGGRRFVYESIVRSAIGFSGMEQERWPEAVVADESGATSVRLRSAVLSYGDGGSLSPPTNRWLSDGSGFIALVADPELPVPKIPVPALERASYRLVRPDARTLDIMSIPRGEIREWYDRVSVWGPEPCPWDPKLVAVGRRSVVDHRSGVTLAAARMVDRSGPAHLDPWSGRPGEMVFSWPYRGHGGAMLPSLIRPSFGTQPPEEPFTFRVVGTGDCLNLRTSPVRAASVVNCLPDGTLLTLDDSPNPQGVSFVRDDEEAWVFVAAPGGERGWVSNAYLQWADAT